MRNPDGDFVALSRRESNESAIRCAEAAFDNAMSRSQYSDPPVILTVKSPADGRISFRLLDIDERERWALIEFRLVLPGVEIACVDWFANRSLSEFRDGLIAFAGRRIESVSLAGVESSLHCQFQWIPSGTEREIYYSMRFSSVVPSDSTIVALGLSYGTRAESVGGKCSGIPTELIDWLEDVGFHFYEKP